MSGPGRRYHRNPFCCMRPAHCCLSPTSTDCSSHLFIYVILRCSIELLREEFQPLYGGGPSQQIKTIKYKHAPIRELAANQPLPQRDLCYLQNGLGLRPSDSLQGPLRRNFEMSQVQVQPRSKGQSVSIKWTCSPRNERTRGVSMPGSMWIFSQSNSKPAMCELCALSVH